MIREVRSARMLSGFNTNFRYRGVLFHVQTEDSGLANPHVITHLFHGGNIMASEKRDYSELVATKSGEALEDDVRGLMQGLHKSMLKELSRGEHDAAIEERMGPDVFRVEDAPPPEPPSVTEEERPPEPAESISRGQAAETQPEVPPSVAADAAPRSEDDANGSTKSGAAQGLSRVFGDRVVSEKPLDEVVLDYLVENARRRKRPTR